MSKYGKPSRSAPPAQKTSGGNTLVGIFVGLVIGVLVAFGVVLYLNKAPLPFQDHKIDTNAGKAAEKKPAAAAPAAAPAATAPAGQPASPAPLPGKPGDKVSDKQRFEFYGILEGKQQATPGAAPAAGTPAAEAKPLPSEVFFLQAGAFQKAADADNLKAKIALTGLEVGTQEVALPEKGTLYRVRVGPYRTPDDMNKARTQLAQAGIQATVIKQKE